MTERGGEPSETDVLQSLLVELGTRYATAGDAARALACLADVDESLERDAVSVWCSIVESEPATGDAEEGAAESDGPEERRAGAMRALATVAREAPAAAPLDVFLAGTTDADPFVRVYASYALEAVARAEPDRLRPHIDRLVSTATPDPNPLGPDVWGAPKRSAPATHVDRLAGAKLLRAALESVYRTETPGPEQWDVVSIIGRRLAGEANDVCDVLVQLLPAGLEVWPDHLALIEQYADRTDPPEIERYCATAICLRLARTCEDRRDGDFDWSNRGDAVDEYALEQLERALATVSEPVLHRALVRGAVDLLRRYAADRFPGECASFEVSARTVHRRLAGAEPVQPTAEARTTLERMLASVREPPPARTTDPESLCERGTTALVAEIAMVDPSLVREHVGWLDDVVTATPVTEVREHDIVLGTCCRALIHVGSAFPDAVATAAPTVQDTLRTVIERSRWDLLDDVLGALVVTAERRPSLLDPFIGTFREWCADPPGEQGPYDLSVDQRSIRYYAVQGVRFDATEETGRVLETVRNDPDATERLRTAARSVSGGP